MTVEKLINDIIAKEGGYVDHPLDRGGPTNFGITQSVLEQYMGHKITEEEVRNLDVNTAKEIYKIYYYMAPHIDRLPDLIQPVIFDMAVNHGPKRAIKLLQNLINRTHIAYVDVDGENGIETQEAAREVYDYMGENFINALVDERINFYHIIISNNQSQSAFLNGWLKRAESFRV